MNNSITRGNDYSNLVTIYGSTYSNAIKKFLTEYDSLTYDNIVDFLNNAMLPAHRMKVNIVVAL